MPMAPPRLCSCGTIVPSGVLCACQVKGNAARKARHDRARPSSHQRGYNAEWRKARTFYLVAHPTCVMMCGNPANTVDHVIPHKGDDRLFWDKSNWQALCTPCHSRHKQRIERKPVAP